MSLAVFNPQAYPGLGWTVTKTPKFNTNVQRAPDGYETRLVQSINPIWKWQFVFEFLHDSPWTGFTSVSELRTLQDFFLSNYGQGGAFLYSDPTDNAVGPALVSGSPNTPLAQLSLVTNGTTYYSPIQRTLGGLYYEDITDLNGAITVYANGVLQTGGVGHNYTVQGPGLSIPSGSYMGLYLQWAAEPTPPITAQFNFYYRVRFDSDSQDFEQFMQQLWTIGGEDMKNGGSTLNLITARPNPA